MIHTDSLALHTEFTSRAENLRIVKPLVLITHDDDYRRELRQIMESAGFPTESFHRGADAIASLRRRTYSLAIVGLDLVDADPFTLCRDASALLPVLAIAGNCSEESCVHALEAGADDCVRRDVAGRELIARVRNILNRAMPAGEVELQSLEISLTEMRVRKGEEHLDLSRGEAELLALLLRHAPAPLSTSSIASLLDARRATVESRIKSLRRKLGPTRLVNREGFGYAIDTGHGTGG